MGRGETGAGTCGSTAAAARAAATSTTATVVARTWAAAAAARAFTAAAHSLAAWESTRNACRHMAEAAAAGRDATVAGGKAVGKDGRVSNAAIADAADLLGAAVRAQRRAGAAFGDAAAQARSSAAEFEIAADACAMAATQRAGGRSAGGPAGRARWRRTRTGGPRWPAGRQGRPGRRRANGRQTWAGGRTGPPGLATGPHWRAGRRAYAPAPSTLGQSG